MNTPLFELITLPYAMDALSPVISSETMSFHYGKHLQTYVNNLNALLPGSGLEGASLEEIVVKADGGMRNNAGQTLNHNLYFSQFKPAGQEGKPTGALGERISAQFGSFEAFKEAFEKAGATLFGSGWVWLSSDGEKQLHITQELNAANPLQKGLTPLLTFDVWEHAYYLDYQNRRPDYLKQLWNIVDWKTIEDRFQATF